MLAKLRRLANEIGGLNAVLYLVDRALAGVSGSRARLFRYYLVAQPVPDKALLPPRRGASIAVEAIGPDDPRAGRFPRPAEVIRFRFAQDPVALAAFIDDQMVGCLWLNLGAYDEDEVRCRFEPGPPGVAGWDYDVYVAPEHRVGLVFARLWDEANRVLRAAGRRWSASRISAFNPASIAAHKRLGGRIVGSAVYLVFGPVQIMLSTARPRFHVGTTAGAAPVLRFDVE